MTNGTLDCQELTVKRAVPNLGKPELPAVECQGPKDTIPPQYPACCRREGA